MKRVLSLCTICWFLFLCGCQQTSNSQNPSVSVQPSVPSEEEHQNAKPYNQDALLLRSDYERLSAIGKSIYQTGTISDEDTDFWVAVVKKGPVVKETDVKERNLKQLGFESIAFGLIVGKKKLSPEQKKKLFDVVLPFTGDRRIDLPDDVEPTVRESLLFTSHTNKLWLLASIDAKRALPVLKQVSQTSANEKVRAEAATILGKIRQKYGYK